MSMRRPGDYEGEYEGYAYPPEAYSQGTGSSGTQWPPHAFPQVPVQSAQFSNMQGYSSHEQPGYSQSNPTWTSSQGGVYNSHPGGPYTGQEAYGTAQYQQSTGYNPGIVQRPGELGQWPVNTSSQSGYTSSSQSTGYQLPPDPYANYSQPTSSSSSQYQASPSDSSTSKTHNYIALPSTDQSTIESYIVAVKPPISTSSSSSSNSRGAYQCTWPGCPKAARGEVFKSKDNARVHVHKHFGTDKLFECVLPSCKKTFASEDAAKRHRDMTGRVFKCTHCNKEFARPDYRDMHLRRCTGWNQFEGA
ncbi:hypothetical protein K439DRAFT_674087 [Ramaria rubella]|nr:hypothetical protein K439DRAFT_674087 [Ramaria rubella]